MRYLRSDCSVCGKETLHYTEIKGPTICIHYQTHRKELIDYDEDMMEWVKQKSFLISWLEGLSYEQIKDVYFEVNKGLKRKGVGYVLGC